MNVLWDVCQLLYYQSNVVRALWHYRSLILQAVEEAKVKLEKETKDANSGVQAVPVKSFCRKKAAPKQSAVVKVKQNKMRKAESKRAKRVAQKLFFFCSWANDTRQTHQQALLELGDRVLDAWRKKRTALEKAERSDEGAKKSGGPNLKFLGTGPPRKFL